MGQASSILDEYSRREDCPPPLFQMIDISAIFENKNLSEVAYSLNLSTEELLEQLKRLNFIVETADQKLSDVALKNKTSPEKIYSFLREGPECSRKSGGG